MVPRAVAFFWALSWLCAPAFAGDVPTAHWKFDNPFCGVVAQVVPLSDRSGYGLTLGSASGTSVDAHVTLVGKTDAYDAHVTAAPLSGPANDRESQTVVVELPAANNALYFYVDSYAIDGGQAVTCPSYVSALGDDSSVAPTEAPRVAAQRLQALGSLKCGHVYDGPQMRGQLQSQVGAYGDRPLTVVGRAYLDSNGHSVREEIVSSSNVLGMDQFLLGAMHVHEFKPAQFLCTPVVSTIEVELKYLP